MRPPSVRRTRATGHAFAVPQHSIDGQIVVVVNISPWRQRALVALAVHRAARGHNPGMRRGTPPRCPTRLSGVPESSPSPPPSGRRGFEGNRGDYIASQHQG